MTQGNLPMEELVDYYNCGDFPFNFLMIKLLGTPPKALEVKEAIESFLAIVPPGRKANWQVGAPSIGLSRSIWGFWQI